MSTYATGLGKCHPTWVEDPVYPKTPKCRLLPPTSVFRNETAFHVGADTEAWKEEDVRRRI